MKKTIVVSLILFVCFSFDTWAATTKYYSRLKTQVAEASSGRGTVYAGKSATAGTYSSTSSTSESQETENEGEGMTFYAFAKANSGYVFAGWSKVDGGSFVSTDNPYEVKIVGTSTNENSPTVETYYANFVAEDATVGVTFKAVENGFYSVSSGGTSFDVGEEDVEKVLLAIDDCQLSAVPNDGYKFMGWYTLKNNKKSYLSRTSPYTTRFVDGSIVYGEFLPKDTPTFLLGNDTYTDLTEAISAAGSATSTIILVEDGTITGDITIPSNVSLLIPYDNAYSLNVGDPSVSTSYSTPSVYKKLTLASDARLEVYGTICVNALQITSSSNTTGSGPGALTGKYGCIHMKEGSTITLKNGAKLYAYGIIEGFGVSQGTKEGSGTIIAESGSSVSESFVIGDWKGGTISSNMRNNSNKVFLFNQYFIQNIQVPLTLNYGAEEYVYTSITASLVGNTTAGVKIIGNSDALFTLGQDSRICKWYDGLNDRLHIETDGALNMENLSINVGISVDTKNYVMPLTNNMTVKVNTGKVTITSDVELLPNAEIDVAEGAELAIKSGASLYVYDIDDWGKYVFTGKYVQPLQAVPNRVNSLLGHTADKNYMRDAAMKVNGTITVDGKLFTSITGANIFSENGGKVVLPNAVGTTEMTTYGFSGVSSVEYSPISIVPAQLKNADESYLATAGSVAGTTYYYGKVRGYWSTEEETFEQGDINMDGTVDVSDVTVLVSMILGNTEINEMADVNGDGEVNVSDVTTLVAIILGKE